MALNEFTAEVNRIAHEQVAAQPKGLFGAVHVNYPESMMAYYFERGFTPEQVLADVKKNVGI